jgi:hypothetical protein
MEIFWDRVKTFFNGENLRHLIIRSYEWFELTLKTIFGKIPYLPVRDLFMNPWFWFIIIFIFMLILLFRRR